MKRPKIDVNTDIAAWGFAWSANRRLQIDVIWMCKLSRKESWLRGSSGEERSGVS